MIEIITSRKTTLIETLSALMDLVAEPDATEQVREYSLKKGVCPECWETMVLHERKDRSAYLKCEYCDLGREVF